MPFLTGTHKWEWILRADEAGAMLVAVHLLRLATMRGSDSIQFGAGRTAKELRMGRSTLYRKLEALQAGWSNRHNTTTKSLAGGQVIG